MVFREIMEIDNHTMHFETDERLTREEIHLIKLIGDYPGNHVIGLANALEITKAAVSSKLKRLEKKGMITKEKDPYNLSRLNIALTDKGYVAYNAHENFHEQFDKTMIELFKNYTEEEIEIILRFAIESRGVLNKFNQNMRL